MESWGDAGDVSLLSISQRILWGAVTNCVWVEWLGAYCPIAVEGKQATNVLILPPRRGCPFSDRLAVLARRPLCLFPFSFLIFYAVDIFFLSSSQSDPLVRCSSVEELTMANMVLFQIIVQQVLPFCVSIFYLNAFVDCQFLSPPPEIAIAPFSRCRLRNRRFFNSSLIQYAAIKLVFLSFHSFFLSLSLSHPPFALVCPAALTGDEAQKL